MRKIAAQREIGYLTIVYICDKDKITPKEKEMRRGGGEGSIQPCEDARRLAKNTNTPSRFAMPLRRFYCSYIHDMAGQFS